MEVKAGEPEQPAPSLLLLDAVIGTGKQKSYLLLLSSLRLLISCKDPWMDGE
jgi:hypothetical protein